MTTRNRSIRRLTFRGLVFMAALSGNVAAWFGLGALVRIAVG